ncbi:hypothetical protein TNCV_4784461 [Trichonephila clavipes]|nr:hypothetical protein TNCV_4784461 [Trichonephila clavipes]
MDLVELWARAPIGGCVDPYKHLIHIEGNQNIEIQVDKFQSELVRGDIPIKCWNSKFWIRYEIDSTDSRHFYFCKSRVERMYWSNTTVEQPFHFDIRNNDECVMGQKIAYQWIVPHIDQWVGSEFCEKK